MPSPREVVNPPDVLTPVGYSHVVRKSGTPHFIAGQVGADASGDIVGPGDVGAQAAQVFANLKAIVEALGGTMADIVKITVFVTDAAARPAVAAARAEHWPAGDLPASTFLVVAGLASPEWLVEVEAVALID